MTKYELSISTDYVKDWGFVEGVREIFQNAIDEDKNGNEMFHDYDDGKLIIGNKKSKLTAKTLLLGISTKRDDNNAIGKHGEGYKVALMVLLRAGYEVTIYNYAAKETWEAKLVNSKKYGATVLTVNATSTVFKKVSEELVFEISGVSKENYESLFDYNLHLITYPEHIKSEYGNVLTSNDYSGKIFVSGLYICTTKAVKFGYDFKPAFIRLDRDRKLVSDFEAKYEAARVITATKDAALIATAIKLPEGEHINSYSVGSNAIQLVAKEFIAEYGHDAIPVVTQSDLNAAGDKAVLVPEALKRLLNEVPNIAAPPKQKTPLQLCVDKLVEKANKLVDYTEEYDFADKVNEDIEELQTMIKELERLAN